MTGGRLTKNSSKTVYKAIPGETPKSSLQTPQFTIDDVMRELKEVKHAINFLSNQYDDLILKVSGIIDDNKQIHIDNEQLKNDNIYLNNEINSIKEFVNEMKQGQLQNNAVIFGLPPLRNLPDVKTYFEKIIEKTNTGANVEEMGITDIYQKKVAENNTIAPIIIKFKTYEKKAQLIQLMKTCKIKTDDIGISSNKIIHMTDQLTPHNQKLLNEAKQLRSHGYKFIWFGHGRIMVRRNEGSGVIFINNSDCLENIKRNSHPNSQSQSQN